MAPKLNRNIFIFVSLLTAFISLSLYLKLFLRYSDPQRADAGTALPPIAEDTPSTPPGAPIDLTLRFQEDGTFQIAVFEDLHFGEGETGILSYSYNR
jgi:hypothetical protein